LQNELLELIQAEQKEDLWDNEVEARTLLKKKTKIASLLNRVKDLCNNFAECKEIAEMLKSEKDAKLSGQLIEEMTSLAQSARTLETECLFSDPLSFNNCFIDFNSGAGGTESNDWTSILLRMYLRFAERLKLKSEIVHSIDGVDAGIKSCTIKITGKNSYGWFKTESGVHRLVRISPFNASGKRMTSFSSVWVYPEVENEIDVTINEQDIRVDTYRSSGAGGQHVNTTDSAVRITHLPTKIVVHCQNNRSQHKNKEMAINMLKAKIHMLEVQKQKDQLQKGHASKPEIGWGSQIRSYVLQPYQIVKDVRTGHEEVDIQKVLDGDLENFVSKSLAMCSSVHPNVCT
jgi:peptide chain release factor 2